jgi:hypothetical protein
MSADGVKLSGTCNRWGDVLMGRTNAAEGIAIVNASQHPALLSTLPLRVLHPANGARVMHLAVSSQSGVAPASSRNTCNH